jgi:hypothetical protein
MLNHTAADVTEKKKKGKPSMGSLRLLRFVGLFLLFALVVITILAIFGPMLNGIIRKHSLAATHLVTAVSILNAEATFEVSSENIILGLRPVEDLDFICVDMYFAEGVSIDKVNSYNDSRLIVNKSWVIGAGRLGIGVGGFRPWKSWCGHGELEAGIHLVEFELRDSMFGEPIYTHQWAIEIEAD